MSLRRRVGVAAFALSLVGASGRAQAPSLDPLGRALRDELARSMAELRLDTLPRPYFLAYRVEEIEMSDAAASLGSLVRGVDSHTRTLAVELRVGDYDFDNTNFLGEPGPAWSMLAGLRGGATLPLDDQYREIRRELWLATDGAYKRAVEQLSQKRAALENQTRPERLPDFTREEPVTITDVVPAPKPDRVAAEGLVRALSALFREMPEVYRSEVSWSAGVHRTRYLNSEGTAFTRASPWVVVRIRASTQGADGMPLADAVAVYGGAPTDLPTREQLADSVRALGGRLARLRAAPLAEVYHGPVLFAGDAAAELFNDVFAPRLLASRRPVSANTMMDQFAARADNPFLDQIGGRVLPTFLSVLDDPTLMRAHGRYVGGFRVDDDGVPARATRVVDHGILKTLLATRVPARGIPKSTGNRRGMGPVVTNLVVTAESGLSDAALKARLTALAAARGRPYGILVRRLGGGGAGGRAAMLQALAEDEGEGETPGFEAALVVRVYPDGHEEPIRNAVISGLSTASFREIVAASESLTVYTTPFHDLGAAVAMLEGVGGGGMNLQVGGAGLGYAASYVVPSVLFEDITVKGPSGNQPKPPLSSPPWVHAARRSSPH
ncbi:MAG TPA: metallopeptidase TldD-related protein [Gemmatimonadales bacterium]|nr:metallopeptidase TldD-related protein [Gemmatimonadales bacterium]